MSNPVVHFEIGCKDSEQTQKFYQEVFDWDIQRNGPSLDIDTKSDLGIQGHMTSLGHEPHQYVTVYIEVDDIKAYIKKIEKGGGKLMVGPVKLPTGLQFAWFTDVGGNIMGLSSNV